MINTKTIKALKSHLNYAKKRDNKRKLRCNYKQGNSKKIQRVLRRKFNKQIAPSRKTDKRFFGRKKKMTADENLKNRALNLLKILNFKSKDGTKNSFHKFYGNYEIIIELNETEPKKSKINYGNTIKIDRYTTSSFKDEENFVVLECVNRLLEMDYRPEDIHLEKAYSSGRKTKGQFLDILVSKDEESFLMIECKVFGKDYEDELRKLKESGGQLFSYFVNDRDAKRLILYSSKIEEKKIISEYSVVNSSEFVGSAKNNIFDNWDKEIIHNKEIFDRYSKSYIFVS